MHFCQIILKSDEQIQRRSFSIFTPFLMLQQPKFYIEFKSLNEFERGSPRKALRGGGLTISH